MDQHQWEDVTIPDYAHPPTAATSVLPFLMIESPTLRQLRGLKPSTSSIHRCIALLRLILFPPLRRSMNDGRAR